MNAEGEMKYVLMKTLLSFLPSATTHHRLTGMMENLLCRLTAMVGDYRLLTPSVQEVTALRLAGAASCAGRGLWMCILASRARTALVTLRRVFLSPSSAWQEGIRVVSQ